MSESLLLATAGGWVTLGLMFFFVRHGSLNMSFLPVFVFKVSSLLIGLSLALGLGVAAGILPALAAMRLKITDALRRN
jgi:ABC-type antimicrobial peptide transport system permease subunit